MTFRFWVLLGVIFSMACEREIKRKDYRPQITTIISNMDSVLVKDSNDQEYWLESRTISESNFKSKIYPLYKELLETANYYELPRIILDSSLKAPIRGYAYMAYAYQIDSLEIKEDSLTIDFPLNVQIGCIGNYSSFQNFKSKARVRGLNNPYPKKFISNPEEDQAVEIENKIREELAVPKRK